MVADRRRWTAVIAACATAWLLALVVTPWLRAGAQGSLAAGVARAFHEACGHICHQQPLRSWTTAGLPWPVCARCGGLYAGAVAGAWLACAGAWRRAPGRPGRRAESLRTVLVVAALPTALSWAAEWSGWPGATNLLRFTLAVPLGAVGAWILTSMAGGQVQ